MASGFFSLVKEEPDSGHEMETTPVALPPTSASMGGHTPPGSGGRHVGCPPLQAAMPLTPISSRQPPLRHMEIDPNFEPVARSRSNTWPLPCPEGYVESEEPVAVPGEGPVVDQARPTGAMGGLGDPTGGPPKKNTSRRNPWGNMSYADLIAQAIMSSPETRATLSQIYDWMVQNVPYFKDKGDSNSSAGWKNSIRHNLSLHNRFMRVQNEGTGKSSWWVLNPDAKPGKSTRRRANTMEGGRYEKKRGRVKKKLEVLRNGLDTTPPPSSSLNENLDIYPDSPHTHAVHPAYSHLSPQDYRPRASSNASSCGGRLSPIPAIESVEPDMHDTQVPPMSPLGSWGGEYWPHHPHPHAHPHHHDRYTDLVDTMGEALKLGPNDSWVGPGRIPNPQDCLKLSQLSPHGPTAHLNGYVHNHHNHHPQGFNTFEEFHRFGPHTPHGPSFPHAPAPHPPLPHQDKLPTPARPHPHNNYSLTNLQVIKHELQVEGNLDFSFPHPHHGHHSHPHLHAQAVAHSHAHGHSHAHTHGHGHPEAAQMATPPGMPYQCSSIAAGNQWVR